MKSDTATIAIIGAVGIAAIFIISTSQALNQGVNDVSQGGQQALNDFGQGGQTAEEDIGTGIGWGAILIAVAWGLTL